MSDPPSGGDPAEAGSAMPVATGPGKVGRRLFWEIAGTAIFFGAPMAGLWAIACWVDFGLPRNRPEGCPRGGPGLLAIFPVLWLCIVAWRVLAAQRKLRSLRPPPSGRFGRLGFEPNRLASACLLVWGVGLSLWAVRVMGRSWTNVVGGSAIFAGGIGVVAVFVRAGIPHVHRFEPLEAVSQRRCDRCGKVEPLPRR